VYIYCWMSLINCVCVCQLTNNLPSIYDDNLPLNVSFKMLPIISVCKHWNCVRNVTCVCGAICKHCRITALWTLSSIIVIKCQLAINIVASICQHYLDYCIYLCGTQCWVYAHVHMLICLCIQSYSMFQ
jgi:hypothetical protein